MHMYSITKVPPGPKSGCAKFIVFSLKVFHLRTKCACPGGCADETHAPPTTHSGNTGGSSSVNGVASGYIGIILMML